jgi:CheY-like chemotaxis protein
MANILVVDDYCETAEFMARWLELLGHTVQTARDGCEAIEIARCQRPNYVVLDIALPKLNGYQVATTLRQELTGPLVIIAISGYAGEEYRRQALAAGCDYHFAKPIESSTLVELLSGFDTRPATPVRDGPFSPAINGRRPLPWTLNQVDKGADLDLPSRWFAPQTLALFARGEMARTDSIRLRSNVGETVRVSKESRFSRVPKPRGWVRMLNRGALPAWPPSSPR